MTISRPTRDLSDRHEADVARVLGGRVTRGSGSSHDKGDGKQERHEETYEFAWDCKATRSASASVRLADWEKIRDQTVGYRPAIPLRFYRDNRLTAPVDLVVVDLNDLAELCEEANAAVRLRKSLDRLTALVERQASHA